MDLQKENRLLAKAIRIASEFFEDKLDKGGMPYILHCLRVMNSISADDPQKRQAAVLHDIVEDSEGLWTSERLLEEGFSYRTVRLIELVSKKPGEEYMDFIRRLMSDKEYGDDAADIKEKDIEDNSNVTRLKGLREKDFKRLEKYVIAYHLLKSRK